jgi:hypothetical protein
VAAAFNGEHHTRAMPAGATPEAPQKVCGFHARGSCKYGDRCALKHEGPPGSGKGSPKGGGKGSDEKGKGKGKGKQKGKTGGKSDRSQSPAQSPRSKNLPCWAWNEGKCERNPCPFVHRALTDQEKKDRPVRPRSPAAAGAKVCSFFMKGKCTKGAGCKDQHPGDGSVPGTPRPSRKKRGGSASGASPAPQS